MRTAVYPAPAIGGTEQDLLSKYNIKMVVQMLNLVQVGRITGPVIFRTNAGV